MKKYAILAAVAALAVAAVVFAQFLNRSANTGFFEVQLDEQINAELVRYGLNPTTGAITNTVVTDGTWCQSLNQVTGPWDIGEGVTCAAAYRNLMTTRDIDFDFSVIAPTDPQIATAIGVIIWGWAIDDSMVPNARVECDALNPAATNFTQRATGTLNDPLAFSGTLGQVGSGNQVEFLCLELVYNGGVIGNGTAATQATISIDAQDIVP